MLSQPVPACASCSAVHAVYRQQEYAAHGDAQAYTSTLRALLSQRETLQNDALRDFIKSRGAARAGAVPALQFPAAPSLRDLGAEREATQHDLCQLPTFCEQPLEVDQMDEAMKRAADPLAGAEPAHMTRSAALLPACNPATCARKRYRPPRRRKRCEPGGSSKVPDAQQAT